MEQYGFWVTTTVVALMISGLGFFLKRTLSELEKKIERSESATTGRFEGLEKRLDKQEERFDAMIKDLPKQYAYRDDLIRMSQGIDSRLDKIQDSLISLIRKEGA